MLFFSLIPQMIYGQKVEAGFLTSAKSFGAVLAIKGRQTTSRMEICTDLYKVIDGTYSSPGYSVGYQMSFPLIDKELDNDVRFAFEAGPGMTAGYVRDWKKGIGIMAGLSGIAVIDMMFRKVTISFSATAILGFHLDGRKSDNMTLDLYRNGLSRAWMPEISLKYRF